jgi:hypothetical protein
MISISSKGICGEDDFRHPRVKEVKILAEKMKQSGGKSGVEKSKAIRFLIAYPGGEVEPALL